VNAATRLRCGFGYDVAGTAIATYWKLPATLVDAIRQQYATEEPEKLDAVCRHVLGAVQLSHALALDSEHLPDDSDVAVWLRRQWPDVDSIYAQLRATAEDTEEVAAALFGA
jgi:hypothetical protein